MSNRIGMLANLLSIAALTLCGGLVKTSQAQDKASGTLAIIVDNSKLYDPLDENGKASLLRNDWRFKGSGGPQCGVIQIWPAAQLKKWVKDWQEAQQEQGGFKKSASYSPAGLRGAYEPPDEITVDNIAEEAIKMEKILAEGGMISFPVVYSFASAVRPLRLKVPAGKYYFKYRFVLAGNTSSGDPEHNEVFPSDYGGESKWGPVTVSVSDGEQVKVRFLPQLFYSNYPRFEQEIKLWFKFLVDNDLEP